MNDYAFYYIELDDFDKKDLHILSYGEVIGTNALSKAFEDTKGIIKEITEKEFILLRDCKGDIPRGIVTLANLQSRIAQYKEDLS
jgi:hypothetical protein